ncbi:hypothetical protein [Geobacter sp.]|uniref:hypothetical protein n=1 Tax=Geobacter sp. TaxID=46610 RepID=UPI001AD12BD3|nr:hypothetical protein [Geobacter sp.]CAG0955991.1 hypothetical protein GEOBC_00462 [Geobacteraceae bacterium]
MRYAGTMIKAMVTLLLLFVAGCGGSGGSDGNNKNGGLTIAKSQVDDSTYTQASFTITYTNPYQSNVLGVELKITTDSDIAGYNSSFTESLNNSGIVTYTFLLPRDTVSDKYFHITAKTGDLLASNTVVVLKQGTVSSTPPTLSVAPSSTITFAATDPISTSRSVLLSGGSGVYSVLAMNPTPSPNISAAISGNVLTVKKETAATGGLVTILVVDTSTPAGNTSIMVNF